MPTYEYVCSSCNNEWEFEQSIKEAALTECPKCNQQTARRQISRGTGFILKGGGWYADLYSSSSNKGGSGSPSSSEGGGSSSGSGSGSSDGGSTSTPSGSTSTPSGSSDSSSAAAA